MKTRKRAAVLFIRGSVHPRFCSSAVLFIRGPLFCNQKTELGHCLEGASP